MKSMPIAIKLAGSALALLGLLLKIHELRTVAGGVVLSGFYYVMMVVGLNLIVLGFAFNYLIASGKHESPPNRRSSNQD